MGIVDSITDHVRGVVGTYFVRRYFGFADAVSDEFAFLEGEFGFRRVEATGISEHELVRFESPIAIVQVYHGRGDFMVAATLELRDDKSVGKFHLEELLRAKGIELPEAVAGYATRPSTLRRALRELADLVKTHAGEVLLGSTEYLQEVGQLREEYWRGMSGERRS